MIQLYNIEKSYGTLKVLKGISLEIPYGEVVSIVGPSGAGKSTLLHIMGTLDKADSGTVQYDGETVSKYGDKQLSKFRNLNIGFVFQFHRLLPEFTMLENVALPALINGTSRQKAFDKAQKLIEYMGLKDRAQHKPNQLSGGECQRAAVARALINDPKVVLADEPTGSLDSQNRKELHRLFFDLRRDLGVTFVIVTHDEALAADCDRIIRLRDGQVESITRRQEPEQETTE